jgi:enediyne biosynthesis protein E4
MLKILNVLYLLIIVLWCSCALDSINIGQKNTLPKTAPKRSDNNNLFGPHLINDKNSKNSFIDKTVKYGLKDIKAVKLYAVDFDNDNYTDLIVLPDYYSVPKFYKFYKKKKKFLPLKYKVIDNPSRASFLIFFDFNKDGIKDFIQGVLNQKSQLSSPSVKIYQGYKKKRKIHYKFVKNIINEDLPSASVSLIDYNLDGLIDLFIGQWFNQKEDDLIMVPDNLYSGTDKKFNFKNDTGRLKNESFYNTEGIKQKKVFYNAKPTYATSTCDIDQNGLPDILTTSTSGHANKLWQNQVNKTGNFFKDIGKTSHYAMDRKGEMLLRGGGNTFTAICVDYNNDQIMDIFLGEQWNSYDGKDRDKSSILTGSKKYGKSNFYRTEYNLDNSMIGWSQGDHRASWFDYNNDGLIDLLVDNSGFPPHSRLILFEQQKNHSFQNVADKVKLDFVNPSGSVIIDINKDGKLDIISSQVSLRNKNIKPRIYAFINNINIGKNRSLRIFLRGNKANTQGIGSMIILKTSEGVKRQWVEYSQGSLPSQNEEGILFGLKENEKVYGIKVIWPYKNKKKNLNHLFNLKSLKFKRSLNITICDSGNYKIGRRKNCQ